ncbi:elongation factor Ts [Clostridium acetireducens DSM 10703]|uniref:Elongation factor Ts n=1 Tax=Clostridium acetireducens DSM 10703 TaxID=1121290 RepID=A0A1E8F248_9CLOT|nr:translation elongation factor Ts [Clostridium acetireducens]OFI07717.1 elongation factor Ts [Clostridium acetireducens DSM 10703]
MITAQMVKELREVTGAGMMDCKKALKEANGDTEKAVELLREKGLAAAAKKAGRIAAEGLIETYISEDKKVGAIVEVNCETDFVAANEDFINLTKNIAKQAAATNAKDIDEFVNESYIANNGKTIKDSVTDLIAKLGENMSARRFGKFAVDSGAIGSYIHGGGRIGVLVKLECEKESEKLEEVAREIAMHVAATNPLYLDEDDVDEASLEKEREIYKVQALNEGKPEKIVEKMVEGRIKKFYKENCLIEQIWVKDPDLTIKKYVEKESKEIGSPIKVAGFIRFERGEGIEKKEEDFAEEVKKQMQQG